MANRNSRQNPRPPTNPFIIIPNFEDQTYNVHSSNIYEQEAIPPPVAGSAATISSPTSGRHPMYRGIRSRSGKWVSEIREPRKTTRIWLGTYATPEMAAAAYDVAALALKGPDATINFPGLADSYPIPASHSASDIRAAAASAATARAEQLQVGAGRYEIGAPQQGYEASSSVENKFVDEEELFEMPKLLADMAEGMLVSPPRMKTAADDDDSPENYSNNDSLWNYP